METFDSISAYEYLIYNLKNEYSQIQYSTLVLKRYGAFIAEVSGTVFFKKDIHLIVKELIDFRKKQIKAYSYEIYRGREKQYWYETSLIPIFHHWYQPFLTINISNQISGITASHLQIFISICLIFLFLSKK